MKRTRIALLFMLALLVLIIGCNTGAREIYEQSTEPFAIDDVSQILQGLKTVEDYVHAMAPTNYSWFFIGEATGETQLTLNNPDGKVEIRFLTKDGAIGGLKDGESEEIPSEILSLDADLVSVEWLNGNFSAISTVRGIGIGDSKAKVLSSFLRRGEGDVMYTVEDVNPQADESWIAEWAIVGGRFIPKGGSGGFYEWDTLVYGWCALNGPDEWKEYYKLEYELEDDLVRSIRLYVEGDEMDEPGEQAPADTQ